MNIIISDVDHPLIIKVASISAAHIQVYFIDNEDYFRRKQMYCDESGAFFQDNDERAIFYARGVLETAKKLRWAPDVIHCQGWISQLVPAYLKKAYKDDPIFSSSKIVLSLYGDTPEAEFRPGFASKAAFGGLDATDLPFLKKPDGINLAKTAIQYADGIIIGSSDVDPKLEKYAKSLKLPVLQYDEAAMKDGSYVEAYNAFYDTI
ncbi:MAG: glycogen/starch synthase, partial [Bacteroidales bacterium]|nr:glycogen/starch synthase [Bacteroidales bacterium]